MKIVSENQFSGKTYFYTIAFSTEENGDPTATAAKKWAAGREGGGKGREGGGGGGSNRQRR